MSGEDVKRELSQIAQHVISQTRHLSSSTKVGNLIADAILKRWPDMDDAALRAELERMKAYYGGMLAQQCQHCAENESELIRLQRELDEARARLEAERETERAKEAQ